MNAPLSTTGVEKRNTYTKTRPASRRRGTVRAQQHPEARFVASRRQAATRAGSDSVQSATQKINKVRSTLKAGETAWMLSGYYLPQLFFALSFIFLIAVAEGSTWTLWFASFAVPAIQLMMISWVCIIIIGTLSMISALLTIQPKINPWVVISFSVCFAGYWVPFLFFGPWVLLWIAAITFQKE